MFVIVRTDRSASQRRFLALQGSEHSYTTSIEDARIYLTHEAASTELCEENESIVSLESLLKGLLHETHPNQADSLLLHPRAG